LAPYKVSIDLLDDGCDGLRLPHLPGLILS
jgi:hypothetical protein